MARLRVAVNPRARIGMLISVLSLLLCFGSLLLAENPGSCFQRQMGRLLVSGTYYAICTLLRKPTVLGSVVSMRSVVCGKRGCEKTVRQKICFATGSVGRAVMFPTGTLVCKTI
jgi:hypothetical protein